MSDTMDEDLVRYINRSGYRKRALKAIGTDLKMPKEIADESDILQNHISTVLRDLRERDVIECVNPSARKGRLYRITADSIEILDKIE
jgi:DNA-binding MarR family transcriptional regulator